MLHQARWLMLLIAAALALQSRGEGGIRLPDQPPKEENQGRSLNFGGDDRGRSPQAQGRGFLDWLGFGEDQDPYIQQATQQCINGDLADCFKAQALRSFDDFFDKQAYQLSDNAVLVKVESQARALVHEPPTLSSQPRSEDSDWDALVKYGMRKIERFLRSTALEFQLDDEVTSNGITAPRFLDDIADEVDIIEDKKAPPFRRHKLKKLIIPMLLILKLFKVKLLLFLPLILGLASFKKFLGFMALIVPGVIGYFKFCKPNLSSPFSPSHYSGPQYSPAGIGLGPYREGHAPAQYAHYDGYGVSKPLSQDSLDFIYICCLLTFI
ncbi:unnamed protein product [Diatraea saccharalis]|uniref:Osiris 2 n=1 Tax=Diatraea saccharalis TaxID=40085 RepID=A0A9P0C9N0_9NEOP|nr:unnamed protein product [Diatraea saccharalis]